EHLAASAGAAGVGDHEDIKRPRQIARCLELPRYFIADPGCQATGVKLCPQEAVAVQVEQWIARQVNEVGPVRLARRRRPGAGVRDRVVELERLPRDDSIR